MGLSVHGTGWRVTGPAWLGFKCVKTGSLITEIGNESKTKWLIKSAYDFIGIIDYFNG